MDIQGCKLVQTCSTYPEQYDVFKGKVQIGYLRLRYGEFTAEYPDCDGETVYTAEPEGDGYFMDSERDFYLEKAVCALLSKCEH
ncbi:putative F-box domain protein [Roseibium sp. TrichSKD4]|uniref:hypothetical protein n=1 Tax=Roseibium sp. TrichSKD4 TaxID=744980 RepID=UPI0001E575A1|nr:hypothetical protein [Roseibium sp. TrichSKD4]EFO30908.1 putative F-box domain protein [Roseibium sp. TrichSKD4]